MNSELPTQLLTYNLCSSNTTTVCLVCILVLYSQVEIHCDDNSYCLYIYAWLNYFQVILHYCIFLMSCY